jgi:predicted peptidase
MMQDFMERSAPRMMKFMRIIGPLLLAVAVLNCGGDSASGPPPGGGGGPVIPPVVGFSKRSEMQSGLAIPFQVWAPQNYTSSKKWPIVVALAGSVERGSDGDKQIGVGMGLLVRAQPNFPAVVVFPQIPSDETGRVAFDAAIYNIISDVLRDYNGDASRVYLTGLSYGGTESLNVLYSNSAPFAAFLAIAPGLCPRCIQGGSESSTLDAAQALVAQRLKTFPIWIHQGDQDQNVPVTMTRALVQAFNTAGATSLKYTEYPGLGHTIWDQVYAKPDVWTWLFAQTR